MPERIPKSIAKLVVFRAFLTSDGSLATGKTIAITISKNGATSFSNPAAGATNATEMSSGFYKFTLGTGDCDTGGPLAWRGAEGTIKDAGDVYEVVNATNAGFTALPDAAAEAAGGLYTRGTGAGQIAQDANGNVRVNLDTIKTQAVTAAAPVTVLASVGTAATSTAQTGDGYAIVNSGAHGNAALKAILDTSGVKIAAASIQAIWDAATSALSTAGSIGKWILDKLDVVLSTRAAPGAAMALTSGERTALANVIEAEIIDETDSEKVLEAITNKIAAVNPDLGGLTVSAITSAVWSAATRRLTDGTNIVLAKGTGVTGFNDLSAAQVNAEADTALADVGLTTTVTGRVDAAISTRLATAGYTAPLDAAATRSAIGLATANLDTQIDALPTNAELATALGTADDAVLALVTLVKAKTDNLPSDPADQSLIIAATDAIIAAVADKTGYRLSAAGVNDILRTALTEGYAADGAAMTLEQWAHMVWSMLCDKAIVGTTLTTKKLDGSTTAMTFTLAPSGDAPTSQVRAT